MSKLISNNLVSCCGEYYVCAELCGRGFLALITPKNNPLFDIVVTNQEGTKSVSIQVKTRSVENRQGWKLGKDIESKQNNPDLFVVLVDLKPEGVPEFYIYEYNNLSERVTELYSEYLSTPKRDGGQRKEVGFRWLDIKYFNDDDRSRKNNWELITNRLKQV